MNFDRIAGIYSRFYGYQKNYYSRVFAEIAPIFDITRFSTVLDVGCGTGALAAALSSLGLQVTGIDNSEKMLETARTQNAGQSVEFIAGDILKGLPFPDKSFDISIASYVAHGLQKKDRLFMYEEMKRVSRNYVLIYDYNQTRGILTSIAEWMEGGDYFQFIKVVEEELCENFSGLQVIQTDKRASCYIAKV